jgi:hypothetical protein
MLPASQNIGQIEPKSQKTFLFLHIESKVTDIFVWGKKAIAIDVLDANIGNYII